MNNLVQISGLGAICASGMSPQALFDACLKGESSVNSEGLAEISPDTFADLRTQTPENLKGSKCTVLAHRAFSQAFLDSGWSSDNLKQAGFIFATTTGKIDLWEKVLCSYDSPALTAEN